MIGRLDLEFVTCPICKGTGKDPRNRKRECQHCVKPGQVYKCSSCGHLMPCPGTDDNILGQTYCMKSQKENE